MKLVRNLPYILIGLLILGALLFVGKVGLEDELRSQLQYCANVDANVWPDYQGNYDKICTAEELQRVKNMLEKK